MKIYLLYDTLHGARIRCQQGCRNVMANIYNRQWPTEKEGKRRRRVGGRRRRHLVSLLALYKEAIYRQLMTISHTPTLKRRKDRYEESALFLQVKGFK